ncbi:hypothetical protein B0T20DRAFT_266610 [Sordaria brevicollis]|uniref:Uncharacterized protein n=1 Tax=Sordaria brevicollis TaxID=83679 RepID=A0AAE0PA93_SORBR|nr:hypothetical protein B0T20DRAFT_266610 [Sordaria brevicollis]
MTESIPLPLVSREACSSRWASPSSNGHNFSKCLEGIPFSFLSGLLRTPAKKMLASWTWSWTWSWRRLCPSFIKGCAEYQYRAVVVCPKPCCFLLSRNLTEIATIATWLSQQPSRWDIPNPWHALRAVDESESADSMPVVIWLSVMSAMKIRGSGERIIWMMSGYRTRLYRGTGFAVSCKLVLAVWSNWGGTARIGSCEREESDCWSSLFEVGVDRQGIC